MIDFVEGKVEYIDAEYVVLSASGVGYRVFTPNPYAFVQDEGKVRRLFTHHHVREDAIHLYGFATRDERDLYRRLLDVSGIGPKGALSIMGVATPEQLVLAIQQENLAYLTKFPGIGKKTAQRMILDLKDKLQGFTPSMVIPSASYVAPPERSGLDEALEALAALGYSDSEVVKIKHGLIEKAKDGATTEQLIKHGLALLMRG
ncbi:Holliday junction branch migration protein RuvA [Brevibacillus dissolubilis]|uniref:Holliday junction branch migration protein RuvA n=1 Tax=Brevibacillus dissolubilis TaxID=1844116 RepID=UPI001115BA5A|nr:Holliday junction branch migration protein RuvA [Brevibacillus dissolubilis]